MRWLLVLIALFALATPAISYDPEEALSDPALEARARALSTELRCLVCQNQSIDDSDATFAKDLRMLVRELLLQGRTDGEIVNYLVERYGEFILLRPFFALHTFALWGFTPFAILVGGGVLIFRARRKNRQETASVEEGTILTKGEQNVLDSLLEEESKSK